MNRKDGKTKNRHDPSTVNNAKTPEEEEYLRSLGFQNFMLAGLHLVYFNKLKSVYFGVQKEVISKY